MYLDTKSSSGEQTLTFLKFCIKTANIPIGYLKITSSRSLIGYYLMNCQNIVNQSVDAKVIFK